MDGFRFDLASALCRDPLGNPMAVPPLIEQCAKDPVLSKVCPRLQTLKAPTLHCMGFAPKTLCLARYFQCSPMRITKLGVRACMQSCGWVRECSVRVRCAAGVFWIGEAHRRALGLRRPVSGEGASSGTALQPSPPATLTHPAQSHHAARLAHASAVHHTGSYSATPGQGPSMALAF